MKTVHTDKAPAAIGPYSQGVVVNNTLFSSGQIALDPATGEIVGSTIEEQAEQVMKNLGAILEEAGSSYEKQLRQYASLLTWETLEHLMKYMENISQKNRQEAAQLLKKLPKNVLCEVEVIAEI